MMNYECLIYGIRSMIYGFALTALISLALYRTLGAEANVEFLIPWRTQLYGYMTLIVTRNSIPQGYTSSSGIYHTGTAPSEQEELAGEKGRFLRKSCYKN